MRRKGDILFFSMIFLASLWLYGQDYIVHRYSETEGLPSSSVFDVTQDLQGRVWFATRSGIAVYDGFTWEKHTTSQGLPPVPILNIRVDKAGRIWALCKTVRCSINVVYNNNTTTVSPLWNAVNSLEIPDCESKTVTSFQLLEPLAKGKSNKSFPIIAMATRERGLLLWNRQNNGKWEIITVEDGLLSNSVSGIAPVSGGEKVYVATQKGLSLLKLDIKNDKITVDNRLNRSLALPSPLIRAIGIEYKDKYADSRLQHSRVWLWGDGWLGYFKPGDSGSPAKMTTLYPLELLLSDKKRAVHLQPDYRTGIYIGNHFELHYLNYNTRSLEQLDIPNGLICGGANSLTIDVEKNIWIAGERGVSKISSRRFSNLHMKHGLLEDEVSAVLEMEPGKFVLGHNLGITVYHWQGKKSRTIRIPERKTVKPEMCRVLEIHQDSQKNIWMPLNRAGLAKLTPRGDITWYDKEKGLPDYITTAWIDGRDNIWLGTNKGIFFKSANDETDKFVHKDVGVFFKNAPRRIYGFAGKLRYIAIHGDGLQAYDPQTHMWRHIEAQDNPNANNIYALKKTWRGQVLVATLAGLYILENETIHKFKRNDFQVDRPVYFILEDNKQRLWFGTDNGVIRWDGKTARTYSPDTGLAGRETNRGAAIQDTQGRIWIGTTGGVSIYDEAFDNNDHFNPPPTVRLMLLETGEKKIPLSNRTNEPIRLSYNDNTFVFHFRAISFMDESAVRFKNKLEGIEEKWSIEHYPGNQMIRYASLQPGIYRFHLKAGNVLGVWSHEVVSPLIIIPQPFHKTWWFFLLISTAAVFIFFGIFRFFSEKRHAALLEEEVEKRTRQLHTVEKQYRNLFEESKDMVFMSSPDGTLVNINPAGVELFGFHSREEALHINSVSDLYYNAADRDAVKEEIERKGFVKDYEIIFKRVNNEPVIGQVTAAAVRDQAGNIAAYRGIIRDITDKKRLEQQLAQAQKMEAIGTLAGGIAHDFNNILGIILGYSELMLEEIPQENQLYLQAGQIRIAAERAAALVKQILAFSRQSKQERKPLKISLILKEALKLLRSTLPSLIEIRQDIRTDSDTVLADVIQVHQIIMNLGTNAAHAMREKGGILQVILDNVFIESDSVAPSDLEVKNSITHKNLKPGPYLRLTVSDTGHGISPDVVKRIFDPFFTTKAPGEGTGMGLAVVHGIVKSHSGDISVYSEPGKGTTFYVYLPQMEDTSKPEAEAGGDEEMIGGSERVLLVDDEEALTEMGKQVLENLGYQVVTQPGAVEALELFRRSPEDFHLVISDVTMPHMSGIQLAKEIKHIKPDMPIILCSGYSTVTTIEQIKALGVDDFIMKPIIKSDLARKVRKVLDESRK